MELIRIGEKIINKKKIISLVDEILKLRQQGLSQKETAAQLSLDRSFISRLETLGEIRKGGRIAVIGFPILNKEEVREALNNEGIEFILLMTEKERWQFVKEMNGLELFNKIMEIATLVRSFDVILVIGSNLRIKVTRALLGKEVIGIEIGQSPLVEDKYVDPFRVLSIIGAVKNPNKRRDAVETDCKR